MKYKWTALIVTSVGTLMGSIDTRIVVIGLPTIAQQLHASADAVIWIGQAYLLASTVGLLLVGRVSDLLGRVKMYNLGFAIFTIGSALSSLSGNPFELIVFRITQGIGAAMIQANSIAILTDATPTNELGTILGLNQAAWRMGSMTGLTISGLILSLTDWRGLFYVNVPIGIIGTIWSYKKLREVSTKDSSRKVDWIGFGLFSVGLTLVLLSITYLSYGVPGFASGFVLLGAGLVVLTAFVKVESSASFPLLDLALFKIKVFALANFAQLLNALVFGAIVLLIALYLQIAQGYTPLHAGLAILPMEVAFLISAIVGGKLSDKHDFKFLSIVGMLIMTLGILVLSTFGETTPYAEIALVIVVTGLGNGLFISPNTKAIMGAVPPNRRGIASGFRNTMYNTGFTASYGFTILFITFGISYGAFTQLLQSPSPQTVVLLSPLGRQFFNGFRDTALILAFLEAIPIVPYILSRYRR